MIARIKSMRANKAEITVQQKSVDDRLFSLTYISSVLITFSLNMIF